MFMLDGDMVFSPRVVMIIDRTSIQRPPAKPTMRYPTAYISAPDGQDVGHAEVDDVPGHGEL